MTSYRRTSEGGAEPRLQAGEQFLIHLLLCTLFVSIYLSIYTHMYTYRHYFYYFPFLYLNYLIFILILFQLTSYPFCSLSSCWEGGKLSEGLRGIESSVGHNHTNKSI